MNNLEAKVLTFECMISIHRNTLLVTWNYKNMDIFFNEQHRSEGSGVGILISKQNFTQNCIESETYGCVGV